jgi:hypothetical protein
MVYWKMLYFNLTLCTYWLLIRLVRWFINTVEVIITETNDRGDYHILAWYILCQLISKVNKCFIKWLKLYNIHVSIICTKCKTRTKAFGTSKCLQTTTTTTFYQYTTAQMLSHFILSSKAQTQDTFNNNYIDKT